MRRNTAARHSQAFTLIELLCVIAIIAILASLLLPAVSKGMVHAHQVQCLGNLKETGIAFQMFQHDHNSQFPMTLPVAEGGTREFVQRGYGVHGEFYFSYRHFQALSNELVNPKLLVCPADFRLPADAFATLRNTNLSYFIGVNATPGSSDAILAGDRNLTNQTIGNLTVLRSRSGDIIRWDGRLHQFKGNVLFADGHVEELNNARIGSALLAHDDLFLPSAQPLSIPTYASSGNDGGASSTPPNTPGSNPSTPDKSGSPGKTDSAKGAPAGSSATHQPASAAKSGSSSSASTRNSENYPADAPVTEIIKRPETNVPIMPSSAPIPASSTSESTLSPIAQLLGEIGEDLRKIAWLLYLILFVLVLIAVYLRLRQRARRKGEEEN